MKPTLLPVTARATTFTGWVMQSLPTIYEDSLSHYELLNKVIQHLNDMGKLTNDMVELWNEVNAWVMNEGLNEAVVKRLNELVALGHWDDIINAKQSDFLAVFATDDVATINAKIESGTLAGKSIKFMDALTTIDSSLIIPTNAEIDFNHTTVS